LSGPRNISTALMYTFAQRKGCDVIDEPYYAYYLTRKGENHPGREETLRSQPSDPYAILAWIRARAEETEELFLKNMPHHIEGVDISVLDDFQPVFLIRHPSLMIHSFSKVIPEVVLDDLALKQQWELLQQFQERGLQPLVVDSASILKDPSSSLPRLCQALDLPFEPSMLLWTPGPLPQDGAWATYWYGSVHASSGLKKKEELPGSIPARYHSLLKESEAYFDLLKSHESL